MPKKSKKKPAAKKPKSAAKERVSRVLNQVKEPLSLLGTLKEEGMANAITFLTMASAMANGAKNNLRLEKIRPQMKELVSSLGFAFREDVERLESRLDELEHLLSEREYDKLKGEEE
jgi:hypothetical protein